MLCIESFFREANYNCILFPAVKCFNIVMKVSYHHGTFIHLISKIYTVNFMQCLEMKLRLLLISSCFIQESLLLYLNLLENINEMLFTHITIIILSKLAKEDLAFPTFDFDPLLFSKISTTSCVSFTYFLSLLIIQKH